jgi:hypothetical protein
MGKDTPQGPKALREARSVKALLKRGLELSLCRHTSLGLMLLPAPLTDPCATSSMIPTKKNAI